MTKTSGIDEDRGEALLRAIGSARRTEISAAAPAVDDQIDDPELVQRITDRVLVQMGEQPSGTAHRPQRRLQPAAGWAAAVACAIALGLALRTTPDAMLPAYAFEAAGIDQSSRAMVAEPAESGRTLSRVSSGNRLVLSLRPQVAVETRVIGELWLANPPVPTLLPTIVAVSAQGALRVDAVVGGGIELDPGRHRLWLVARVPEAATPIRRLLESPSEIVEPGLHGVAIEIDVVSPEGQGR